MKPELRREIDDLVDWLIEDGKKLAEVSKIYLKVEERKPKEVEEAQMRNLLDMATATDSIKALELFIQYQVGREKLPQDFGSALCGKIAGELSKKADELTKNVPESKKEVSLTLVRLYIGYMNRYFKYRKKFSEGI